jgi:DNA mismatch repair protein MutH
MKLIDAIPTLEAIEFKSFREFMSETVLESIIVNKGKAGQVLEILIGLNNGSYKLDFEDGELKTNKCDSKGFPQETIFITQVKGIIDELINERPFAQSRIYEKINNLLYVPVCKDSEDPGDWFFLPHIHVDLNTYEFRLVRKQLEIDYYSICTTIRNQLNSHPRAEIHTTSGELIQIRTKDAKPYKPIYSRIYGRYVSNKDFAFYFKKEFVYAIKDATDSWL